MRGLHVDSEPSLTYFWPAHPVKAEFFIMLITSLRFAAHLLCGKSFQELLVVTGIPATCSRWSECGSGFGTLQIWDGLCVELVLIVLHVSAPPILRSGSPIQLSLVIPYWEYSVIRLPCGWRDLCRRHDLLRASTSGRPFIMH